MKHLRQHSDVHDDCMDTTNLLQGQDEFVEASSLRQRDFGRSHVVQQRQDGDLIRGHPVFDAEHVSVDHSVRHHGVEIQTFMHTRHFNKSCWATAKRERSTFSGEKS